jgi:ArsR family transcriptional regulator
MLQHKTSLTEEQMYDLAELFKVFGDSTRVKILHTLSQMAQCQCGNPQCENCTPGLCVGDLAQKLSMTQPAISYQLRILKQAKLVKNRRVGKQICYALADDHVKTILRMAQEHLEEA